MEGKKVKKILKEIAKEVTGIPNIPDLAEEWDMTKQALYNWVQRGSIPLKTVKQKLPNINVAFLEGRSDQMILEDAELSVSAARLYNQLRSGVSGTPSLDDVQLQIELAEEALRSARELLNKLENDRQ